MMWCVGERRILLGLFLSLEGVEMIVMVGSSTSPSSSESSSGTPTRLA